MFDLRKSVAKGVRNVVTAAVAYIPIAATAEYGIGLNGTTLTIDLEKVLTSVGIFVGTVVWDWAKRSLLRR